MKVIIIELRAHTAGHYSIELYEYASALNKKGFGVTIVTPFGFKEEFSMPACNIINYYGKKSKDKLTLKQQIEIFRYSINLRKGNTDIIHIWGFQSTLALFIGFIAAKNIFVTLKTVYREREGMFKLPLLKYIQELSSEFLLKKMNCTYIVHTDALAEDAKRAGINIKKVKVIDLGIPSDYENESKDDFIYKLDRNFNYILFFGVIREEKGIFDLLDLPDNLPRGTKLIIAGENWTSVQLRTIFPEDKVLIYDSYIPEPMLHSLFNSVSAVLIYHSESFKGESGVLLQCIQFGVPVLAIKNSHAGDFIQKHNIGVTIQERKSSYIVEAYEKLLNSEKRLRLNLECLKSEMTWDKIINKYTQLYKTAVYNE